MRRVNQQGIVLVCCLLMCLILSLLLLGNLQTNILERKLFIRQQVTTELNANADKFSQNIIHYFDNSTSECIVAANTVNYYPNQLLTNVQSSCHFSNHNILFDYVIEDIGVLPCIMVTEQQHTFPAHFYRVNLLAQQGVNKRLLQQVFVILDQVPPKTCNQASIQVITSGSQSWRVVTTRGG